MRKDERARLTPPPRLASSRGPGPGRRDAGPPPGQDRSAAKTWWIGAALLAVALVLVGAVSTFMLLGPGRGNRTAMPTAAVAPDDASPASAMESPVPVAAGSDPAPGGIGIQNTPSPRAAREQAYLRDEAGESMARVARQRERLEEQGVSIWGVEEMQRAAAGLAAADAAFTAGRYGEARDGYDAAGATLDELGARAPQVQQQALADGEAALAAGRMTEAAAAFALALRVDPEDEQALAGRRSAESLDQVLALLNEGDGHQRAGRLTEAEARYRQAASLDPGSQPAREALRRVRDRMRGEATSAALSEGFAALEAGQFAAARAAFARAGSIAPDSLMVADGLARVDEAEMLQRIAGHRQQAAVAEAGENWRAALAEHEAALALDATLTFAQEGRQRTAVRAEMQESLAAYTAGAARLGDDEVFREATALLEEARQVAPAGPRHLAQVEELARWLDVMGRSLPVTLLSDGKTKITVYRVGRLGAFERHDLDLRPGTYTVVGQRDGYRDVRRTLTVKPGQAPAPLRDPLRGSLVTGMVLATGDGPERRLAPADFPLALEAGPGAVEPAGWLGMEGGELFVQPALPAATEILCNGSPVMASQWLRAGDVVRYGDAVLRLEAAGSGLTLRFEMGGTRPGQSAAQEVAPEAGTASESSSATQSARPPAAGTQVMPPGGKPQLIVRPAAYVPRAQRRPARRRRRLRPAAILPWVLLAVLGVAGWLVFTMRSVEIRVEPAPDRMSLTGSPLAWAMGGRHMLRPGTYRLTAEKAGHARLDETLEVTDDPYQSFAFTLEKLPGRVVVDAGDVQGAVVSLDGEPVGITPLAELELAAGSYRLEVQAERYREFVTDLTVRGGGETETVQVVLQPLWSPVTFRSSPAGAELKIDGEEAGRTPVTKELLAGTHIYEISLAGHRPFRASVQVAPETPLEVPVVDLAAADGRLRIVTEPAGATVSVDGQVRGASPLEVAVSPGVPHEVAASAAGHDGARRSVQVAAGRRQEVALTLPPRLGTIVFAAEPGDADLIVDGTPRGQASQSLELPAVSHAIEIRKAGHETYRTTVTPRPGFEQSVRVTLKTVAQVQAEKTPPVATTSQGQKMILVPPGRFTMGAPRREPGRRSNETLREIAITHPYYLSATEVSNSQFREFNPGHLSGASGDVNLEIDTHPVVRVTWLEAARYCNWLSGKEGLPPVYDITGGVVRARRPFGPGYRLPTEAEWVWAARYAGGRGKQKYPWGDSLPPVAGSDNYADAAAAGTLSTTLPGFSDDFAGTAPVEQFPANALGLHSLGGNVAEWMHDLYTIYPPSSTPEQDPMGGDEGELHVIRGGSWMKAVISELRLSYREYGVEARPDLGFRIARSPE